MKGALIASSTQEIYQSSPVGRLLLTQVEGYDSPEAQTTEYSYDARGNLICTHHHNGSITEYGYDLLGRMISMSQAWSTEGYRKVSYYSYSASTEEQYSAEYALVREEIVNPQYSLRQHR